MPDDRPCAALHTTCEVTGYLVHAARLLDAALTRKDFSNVQLAKLLQVPRDAVSKQRRGKKWLEVPALIQLCFHAEVSLADLFPDDPTSVDSQLQQTIAGLPPEAKATLLPMVKTMRDLAHVYAKL